MTTRKELSDLFLSLGAAFKTIEQIDTELEQQMRNVESAQFSRENMFLFDELGDHLLDASKIYEEICEEMAARKLTQDGHGWEGGPFVGLRRKWTKGRHQS